MKKRLGLANLKTIDVNSITGLDYPIVISAY